MQRAKLREQPEQTMQRFLSGLSFNVKRIVRHHQYGDIQDLLHQAREAELQLAEDAKFTRRPSYSRGSYTPRVTPSAVAPTPASVSRDSTPATSKFSSAAPTPKPAPNPSVSVGSSNSTARTRDMNCHTCGGKDHFKRDCPNRKVMLINEETGEYESGDEVETEPDFVEEEDGACYADAVRLPSIV